MLTVLESVNTDKLYKGKPIAEYASNRNGANIEAMTNNSNTL